MNRTGAATAAAIVSLCWGSLAYGADLATRYHRGHHHRLVVSTQPAVVPLGYGYGGYGNGPGPGWQYSGVGPGYGAGFAPGYGYMGPGYETYGLDFGY